MSKGISISKVESFSKLRDERSHERGELEERRAELGHNLALEKRQLSRLAVSELAAQALRNKDSKQEYEEKQNEVKQNCGLYKAQIEQVEEALLLNMEAMEEVQPYGAYDLAQEEMPKLGDCESNHMSELSVKSSDAEPTLKIQHRNLPTMLPKYGKERNSIEDPLNFVVRLEAALVGHGIDTERWPSVLPGLLENNDLIMLAMSWFRQGLEWNDVKAKFMESQVSQATRLLYKRELKHLRKKYDQSVRDYCQKFEGLVHRIGNVKDDEDLVIDFFESFSEDAVFKARLDNAVLSRESLSDVSWTLKEAKELVLRIDSKLKLADSIQPKEQKFKAAGCNWCGVPTHKESDCLKKKNNVPRKVGGVAPGPFRRDMSKVKCHNCGVFGHLQYRCPKEKRDSDKQGQSSSPPAIRKTSEKQQEAPKVGGVSERDGDSIDDLLDGLADGFSDSQ